MTTKILIGADHRGVEERKYLAEYFGKYPHLATDETGAVAADQPTDYPFVSQSVVLALKNGSADVGILLCGSGNGVAIAANRYEGIFAAVCRTPEEAKATRKHNNANILCMGTDFSGSRQMVTMVVSFLETEFDAGRHLRRIEMIDWLPHQ